MPPGDDRGAGELDTVLSADSAAATETGRETSPPTLIGGRYQIQSLAGSGSMGSVYRAHDTELDEIVALKFLRPDLVRSPEILERFRREVRLARRVAHRHVARVYDIGDHDGEKFFTMAFIEGEPLRALLRRSRPLPVSRAVSIARAVCEGLAAAHAVGVVHRDLKPDNVMLASDGGVAITDFGIARSAEIIEGGPIATLGSAVGTPAYMAPEQVEAASDIDGRADIYALGVMLFEMLTGELPFSGGSAIAVAAARLDGVVPDPRDLRPTLDPELSALVQRCMARWPGDRFARAADVEAALSRVTASDSSPVPLALPERPAATATAAGDKTVAVIPFRNAGGGDEAYLADGLTEDLIDTLSTARGLRVRPRVASQRFSGDDRDARAIGRELDVQVVVDGSVRRRGDMLRVTARLVSVAEGFQLWARRFDRPAGDALMVSDEVADAVARALTVAPVGHKRKAPTDPSAIDLYLRGRAELRDLGGDAMARAVAFLEVAHARAPDDPTLLAVLARAHARSFFFRTDPASIAHALELAERALAAAPDHADALLALAQVRFARGSVGDYRVAAEHVRAAVDRAPYLPEAYELLARIRLEVGPLDEGIAAAERALTLDPLLLTARLELARGHGLRGDFDAAMNLVATAPDGDRAARGPFVARLLAWSREPAKWAQLLPPIEAFPGTPGLVESVVAMLIAGRVDREVHDRFLALATPDRPVRFRVLMTQLAAEFSAFAGDPAAALDRIAEAIDLGLIDLMWLDHCPHFASLRAEARFASLRDRLDALAAPIRDALDRP